MTESYNMKHKIIKKGKNGFGSLMVHCVLVKIYGYI